MLERKIIDDRIERFIDMVQTEVIDDIREHVHSSINKNDEKHMVMKLLAKPITDYVIAMTIDNLLTKELLDPKEIIDE